MPPASSTTTASRLVVSSLLADAPRSKRGPGCFCSGLHQPAPVPGARGLRLRIFAVAGRPDRQRCRILRISKMTRGPVILNVRGPLSSRARTAERRPELHHSGAGSYIWADC